MLKIGAWVQESIGRIWIHFSLAYPEQEIFWRVLGRFHST